MFDIGLLELLLLSIVVLLVVGPKRLPETLRTLGLWIGRMRRSFTRVKAEIEREIGMDDVRRQLHNESIMEQMKEIERDVGGAIEDAGRAAEDPAQTIHNTEGPTGNQALEPSSPVTEPDDSPRKARDGR
ncbi:MAG: Sec-independent protein translocase protein TatB [Gammaproteobacteria bacterium]|nr:Sec-independent protein translocase protein TatB [Gammaproteobacteria bacterium]